LASPIPLIDFQNVTVRRGRRVVLESVTLSIAQGEHAAILGPNGSGKSTLIKVISRDLYPVIKAEPWSLRILGRERWHLFDLRNHLGIVSNDWMQMCTRDYSGYEIVLSGFFGSVGIWPYSRGDARNGAEGAGGDGTARDSAPGRT
jgi:iron complex transport system ATP-binding protein